MALFLRRLLASIRPQASERLWCILYTVEVVQCQIQLVSQILRERFGRPYSFADEDVTTLDPGAGTGTYLVAAIRHALQQVREHEGEGAVAGRATRLARNLIGFEILIGPYAVAHLRLTRELTGEDAGGVLPEDGLRFHLADTLDSPHTLPPGGLEHVLTHRRLVQERERARHIKAEERVLVCLGNPPYDRHPASEDDPRGGWVRYGDEGQERPIFDAFTEPARRAGRGVHLKNLYNLYVYFWRWALWKVFEVEPGAPSQSGIVSFITASSYLAGPGFVGMREHMRRSFDELWIINLGGDNLGARREPNVFNIQSPVAIAIGARRQDNAPDQPAVTHYTRINGTREEKLRRLSAVGSFADLDWQLCPNSWHGLFLPSGDTNYFDWPALIDLFPWQHSGVQFKRTWPIAPTRELLEERWRAFTRMPVDQRREQFHETRDRTINGIYDDGLPGSGESSLAEVQQEDRPPLAVRYGYRSFDRQWALYDTRLGDYLKASLWRTLGDHQIFLTTLTTHNLGLGPAATVTASIPDLHHFRGSFGGADVIPLWREPGGARPNVTNGLLELVGGSYGEAIGAEDLFAYVYGVLGGLSYTSRFWNELETPGPRVPITRDTDLFRRMSSLGRRLIWLHTYGARMIPNGEVRRVPQGDARVIRGIPGTEDAYPEDFDYVLTERRIRVGQGFLGPVAPDVWAYEVSGLQVIKSWLDYRKKSGYGRRSSSLDEIRPRQWTDTMTTELLELLWVIEHTLPMEGDLEATLDQIVAGPCFEARELPSPARRERQAPVTRRLRALQEELV